MKDLEYWIDYLREYRKQIIRQLRKCWIKRGKNGADLANLTTVTDLRYRNHQDPYFLADENGNCHVEADGTVPTFASKEDGEQYIKDHYAPKKREVIVKITGDLTDISNPIPPYEAALRVKQTLEYRFTNTVEILEAKDI